MLTHGVASLVFTASTTATTTIAHGLGRTPVTVLCTRNFLPPGVALLDPGVTNLTPTTFDLNGSALASNTGSYPYFWAAVG
jgi:hypothetical protein